MVYKIQTPLEIIQAGSTLREVVLLSPLIHMDVPQQMQNIFFPISSSYGGRHQETETCRQQI
ncbi:hypothetical protein HanXRQr2_Chr03g0087511 [Helianthus annuus]|uniref:Uncharacterized protein n=1 Tax=Helianthus annuus TaxID=4232 RepID=A0A9K3JCN3_HELAN|nr:hypothetical protein HanXRQr2_Chr03g0087511 [Helianthus annuus]KAJ0941785.1 hypothetical protein HanPSC8_Chr03g0084171 [Helianthus annuus]